LRTALTVHVQHQLRLAERHHAEVDETIGKQQYLFGRRIGPA